MICARMTVVRISIQPAINQNAPKRDVSDSQVGAEAAEPHPYDAIVKSRSIRKLSHGSEELLNTVSVENLKDFEWYFEQYVINDPFAHARAQTIRRRLRSQGQQLLKNYLLPEIRPSIGDPEHFLIEVRDVECHDLPEASTLHRFFWEILEDKGLWRDVFQIEPSGVTVVRIYKNKTSTTTTGDAKRAASILGSKTTNVLAITARPFHTKDVPHRLITRSISAAIESIRDHSTSRATLEIVRPGTFDALKRHLARFPPGHFEIVHLDLHGDADGQG